MVYILFVVYMCLYMYASVECEKKILGYAVESRSAENEQKNEKNKKKKNKKSRQKSKSENKLLKIAKEISGYLMLASIIVYMFTKSYEITILMWILVGIAYQILDRLILKVADKNEKHMKIILPFSAIIVVLNIVFYFICRVLIK
ncbi:MAG: hypothetical protein ACRC6T_01835 [Sarcina sp.]